MLRAISIYKNLDSLALWGDPKTLIEWTQKSFSNYSTPEWTFNKTLTPDGTMIINVTLQLASVPQL